MMFWSSWLCIQFTAILCTKKKIPWKRRNTWCYPPTNIKLFLTQSNPTQKGQYYKLLLSQCFPCIFLPMAKAHSITNGSILHSIQSHAENLQFFKQLLDVRQNKNKIQREKKNNETHHPLNIIKLLQNSFTWNPSELNLSWLHTL